MSDRIATGAAYGTSIATLIAGLTLNEWAAAAGIIGVFGTLGVNWYFKHREFRQAQAEHEIRMARERSTLEILNRKLQAAGRREKPLNNSGCHSGGHHDE